MNAVEFILAGMLAAATPFLLAALGELVVERAGVLNLGVEGLMAFGAVLAFIVVFHGGGHFLGFLAAGIGTALLSLLFALVALGFRANQVATGLAIGILGQGLSALFGKTYESLTVKGLPKIGIPGLSEIPVLGKLFVQAVTRSDFTLVQALVLLVAVFFIVINFVIDLLYAWLDPRIRYR